MNDTTPLSALEALQRLQAGNSRFCNGLRSLDSMASPAKLKELAEKGQRPFSIVLACSDSRVPAETIFDCGLGDLFVIRVAGNVIAPTIVASIEFAAAKFGTPLCVVMGHSLCGAIEAAVQAERSTSPELSPHVQQLVDQIRPAASYALRNFEASDAKTIQQQTTLENVRRSVSTIHEQSAVLRKLMQSNQFMLVGAVYDIAEGHVTFLNDQRAGMMRDPVSQAITDGRRLWS